MPVALDHNPTAERHQERAALGAAGVLELPGMWVGLDAETQRPDRLLGRVLRGAGVAYGILPSMA